MKPKKVQESFGIIVLSSNILLLNIDLWGFFISLTSTIQKIHSNHILQKQNNNNKKYSHLCEVR